jgi:hypothetical protein
VCRPDNIKAAAIDQRATQHNGTTLKFNFIFAVPKHPHVEQPFIQTTLCAIAHILDIKVWLALKRRLPGFLEGSTSFDCVQPLPAPSSLH